MHLTSLLLPFFLSFHYFYSPIRVNRITSIFLAIALLQHPLHSKFLSQQFLITVLLIGCWQLLLEGILTTVEFYQSFILNSYIPHNITNTPLLPFPFLAPVVLRTGGWVLGWSLVSLAPARQRTVFHYSPIHTLVQSCY